MREGWENSIPKLVLFVAMSKRKSRISYMYSFKQDKTYINLVKWLSVHRSNVKIK